VMEMWSQYTQTWCDWAREMRQVRKRQVIRGWQITFCP